MVLVRHSIEEAILLRQETDPGFLELKQHIRDLIHEEYERERVFSNSGMSLNAVNLMGVRVKRRLWIDGGWIGRALTGLRSELSRLDCRSFR